MSITPVSAENLEEIIEGLSARIHDIKVRL
jgi:hypothetical protein